MSAANPSQDAKPPRTVDRFNINTRANINLPIAFQAASTRVNCFDWGFVKEWNGGVDKPCELSKEFVRIQLKNPPSHDKEGGFRLDGEEAKKVREMIGTEKGAKGKKVVNAGKAVWKRDLVVYVFFNGQITEVQTEEQVMESYGVSIRKWWNNPNGGHLQYLRDKQPGI